MSTELLDEPEVETESQQATWTLNFGPQHPATHTTLRLILELDGERIVKATPDIGYLHSGFEKLGEHLNFNQYVTVVDRKNYISPPMNEVAWHHAVEKLLDIELTPRCQYIRVIISELARISDHLLCTGAAALDLGAFTAFLFAFNLREQIYDVYEEMSGYRFHPGYTRVGGVLYDFNDRVLDKVRAVLASFPKVYSDMEKLLFRNRIFLDRVRGVGVLSKADAIAYSCTGPIARASGVTYDLRKDEPYLAYPEFDFEVPYTDEGDCWARFIVRMEEMRQSHRILEQALAETPVGPRQRADRREVSLARQADHLQQHGRLDPAFRADHAQSRGRDAARRGLCRRREPQRRAGLLPGRRRQPDRLARADPAAVVHPLFGLPAHDQRLLARRRGRRAGELEHHRGRARSMSDSSCVGTAHWSKYEAITVGNAHPTVKRRPWQPRRRQPRRSSGCRS